MSKFARCQHHGLAREHPLLVIESVAVAFVFHYEPIALDGNRSFSLGSQPA